ncbi:metalloregulator ArsR/SmtB family transcription factor [Nitratireductor aquimarinus]|uniref:Metalloregulator ArsR/SmtB family transcription factor n=1 Tax=Nitratireductor aquimarinus TaxID=889300 RepID=A0ABU4AR19_9HYPH|nr:MULTISPECIES: metalloregulator ArsR/SmtB family transcription factor [Alphaproteobacteria]MBY6024374.1 metalloregulator ArsR/SmtB family transcription factor [Nitratireductor sp. DP7N14-4]MBN7759108.1 helix-turn-helix transcriptional regulator [Nitratireductor aquimarinus]MBN7778537.1 helix-turn-helix transcriptional regulator [Nitratireductor pacificus]MBN7782859.1 helix-turn-helix transcriptional regulator [Nitratireductor pacificus]MBN7791666.1 helix-turn-helix transcriptional regulator 
MVEYQSPHLDAVFHALSDPTRRAMLHRLSAGKHSVSQLAEPFDMSLAGASKHVKVLEAAGLVSRHVEGRTHYCRLEAARLAEAQAWFRYYERFWSDRLDALQNILEAEDRQKPPAEKG